MTGGKDIMGLRSVPELTRILEAEGVVGTIATADDVHRHYVAHIVVNTEPPLAAGREIWGVPKKLAEVAQRAEHGLFIGTADRPRGNRLCTAIVRPERPVPVDRPLGNLPLLTLRVIPNPEESREPSLVELISTRMSMTPHHLWRGTGSLSLDAHSDIDPL